MVRDAWRVRFARGREAWVRGEGVFVVVMESLMLRSMNMFYLSLELRRKILSRPSSSSPTTWKYKLTSSTLSNSLKSIISRTTPPTWETLSMGNWTSPKQQ